MEIPLSEIKVSVEEKAFSGFYLIKVPDEMSDKDIDRIARHLKKNNLFRGAFYMVVRKSFTLAALSDRDILESKKIFDRLAARVMKQRGY